MLTERYIIVCGAAFLPERKRRMPPSRREELVEAAVRVFYRHGFHASGLDSVLQEAGVSRMTLYNHFKSKDELIVAALRRRDEVFRNRMMKFVDGAGDSARGRLLAVFDFHEQWFTGKDFCGCMFINATAEFADPKCAVRQVAAEHKRAIVRYLEGLARACGVLQPEAVAQELNLLLEGSIVTAAITGQTQDGGADVGASARLAKSMAERILDAAG
jgi:AcrR family transcriptional regulator